MHDSRPLPLISLFTGAGGLDLGLEQAGFEARVAVEVDRWARETLATNRAHFRAGPVPLLEDITAHTPEQVMQAAGLRRGEAALVAGGPPCQSFSTAGRRGSLGDPRGGLFANFAAIVEAARPRFFIMENVRGLLSAAIRHRPLADRGPLSPPLADDEIQGSAFAVIRRVFEGALGYQVVAGLVDAADYGVPQNRLRVLLFGSRDHEFPAGATLEDLAPPTQRGRWVTLRDALAAVDGSAPEYLPYSPGRAALMRAVPPGKNWRWFRDHPEYGHDFAREAMGGAWGSEGGRVGFFRRLPWDKPSPTLPTSPVQKSTSLCHPEETRPLSVQEYAAIQQFPPDYRFAGSTARKYRQIGNAVPVGLGRAAGMALVAFARAEAPAGAARVVASGATGA